MLDKIGGDVLSRVKSMFGGEKNKQSPEMDVASESEMAVEKFRLMAAAGSEGQTPAVSYGSGNTIVLSDLPMGTVFRERFTSDHNPGVDMYIFYYVGGMDKGKNQLRLYDAQQPRVDARLPYISNTPYLGCRKRELPLGKSQKLEYEIGQQGVLLDLEFRHSPHARFNQMYKDRQTTQIDIMEFGKRVKQEVKQQDSVPLGQLVPSPQAI